MVAVPTFSFEDARACASRAVTTCRTGQIRQETVGIHQCAGRVLAEPLVADRDYPADCKIRSRRIRDPRRGLTEVRFN